MTTEMGRTSSTHGAIHKMHIEFVEKPEGKRPLGRPRRIWEDNIQMNLREVGCDPGE